MLGNDVHVIDLIMCDFDTHGCDPANERRHAIDAGRRCFNCRSW